MEKDKLGGLEIKDICQFSICPDSNNWRGGGGRGYGGRVKEDLRRLNTVKRVGKLFC